MRSPDQRDKLEAWINRAALKVGPPDGSMHVPWVNSILHWDAVTVREAKQPAWRVTKFQAIITFPNNMDLWEEFEEIYHNDGEEAARAFYGQRKVEMDAGAMVNWPSMQPLVWLMLQRAGGHDSFATELLFLTQN